MKALCAHAQFFLVAWVYTFVFYVDLDGTTPKPQLILEAAIAALFITIASLFTGDIEDEDGHHHGHHHHF